MRIIKKIFNGLIFKCLCSITAGASIVTIFAFMLSIYGIGKDAKIIKTQTAKQSIEFPENKKMLNDMSAKLIKDGSALAINKNFILEDIAPAAGDVEKDISSQK